MDNAQKNLKLGIVGWWYGANYGSIVTYYSLYMHLSRKLGIDVYMITPPSRKEYPNSYPQNEHLAVEFSRKYYKITDWIPTERLYELNNNLDAFILGSDQLWNYATGYTHFHMLSFADATKRKVATATSFGHDKLFFPASIKDEVKFFMRRLDAVSIREASGIDIARREFGVDARLILDPIFLTDSKGYAEIGKKAAEKPDEKYIFAYILDPTDEKKAALKQLSEKLKLKVISVVDRQLNPEAKREAMKDFGVIDASVEEFLYLFENSVYVMTDSFHGTCLSIIFGKPFVSIENIMRGTSRFRSLAEMLGIGGRIVESATEIAGRADLAEAFDYGPVLERMEALKHEAEKWIENALFEGSEPIPELQINIPAIPQLQYGINSYKSKVFEPYSVCPKNKCTGCAACANICRVDAITLKEDQEGFPYPVIDNAKCTHCGMCSRICPPMHLPVKTDAPPLAVYAGFSNSNDARYLSTSGGAFTEFARYILQMSGVCYGAAYGDGFAVSHIRIDDEADIPKIRQSKYYQSNIKHTFRQVKKDLESGRYVAFCGAPCQCAGLFNYLRKDYAKLLIIDFICHSVCSPKAFRAYLKDIEARCDGKAKRVWFKNKETTWQSFSLRIDFEGKRGYYRERHAKDPYFKGFLKYRAYMRPSCHDCRFKGYHRTADVTLADFWGLKWKNPTLNDTHMSKGVSAILINSEKGKDAFSKFVYERMYIEEHTLEEVLKGNGGYHNSQTPGLYRDAFFANVDTVPFCELIKAFDDREEKRNRQGGAR